MRAVIAGGLLAEAPEDVERRVALRLARQKLLERTDGFLLWAVLDEAALRRPIGGAKVLRDQLERLVEATTLPTVTLQVLPFTAETHPATVGGFSILRFADPELPDVVYIEHLTDALTWTTAATSTGTWRSCTASMSRARPRTRPWSSSTGSSRRTDTRMHRPPDGQERPP